jgi:hypothetical protein
MVRFGMVALVLAEAAPRKGLPPPTRAAVQMALIAIGLVGMLLVVMVLLGGHWVRRQGTHRRGPSVPADRSPIKPVEPQRSGERQDEDA